MSNPFCHIELHANNVETAKSFYSSLFNWKLSDMQICDDHTYTMIDVGEGTGGGMLTNPIPDAPSHWLSYVQVENLAAATEKAKSLGATIIQEPTEVPNFGSLSVISDPTGATLGLWQPVG